MKQTCWLSGVNQSVFLCGIFWIQQAEDGLIALTMLRGCNNTVKTMYHSLVLFFSCGRGESFLLTHSQIGGFDVCVQLQKILDWVQCMLLFRCLMNDQAYSFQ